MSKINQLARTILDSKKYIVDVFDSKNVWLLANEDEVKETYLFGQEPPTEQFTRDFEAFRTTKGSTPIIQREFV